MAHTVVIGGLGVKSSIALAQLNKTTGQLTITDRFVKAAGPSPAFMAWGKGSNSPAVSNILIANHAGNQGEAMTSMQLYPPYAKQTGSVKTDDPCHISLHPSGRWVRNAPCVHISSNTSVLHVGTGTASCLAYAAVAGLLVANAALHLYCAWFTEVVLSSCQSVSRNRAVCSCGSLIDACNHTVQPSHFSTTVFNAQGITCIPSSTLFRQQACLQQGARV